jgi:hypothetical protein
MLWIRENWHFVKISDSCQTENHVPDDIDILAVNVFVTALFIQLVVMFGNYPLNDGAPRPVSQPVHPYVIFVKPLE